MYFNTLVTSPDLQMSQASSQNLNISSRLVRPVSISNFKYKWYITVGIAAHDGLQQYKTLKSRAHP